MTQLERNPDFSLQIFETMIYRTIEFFSVFGEEFYQQFRRKWVNFNTINLRNYLLQFPIHSSTSLLQIDMLQIILNCQNPPWTRRDFDLD